MNKENSSSKTEDIANAILECGTLTHTLRMKQGNFVSINQIPFSPEMFRMCPEMELVEVKTVYEYDDNNKPILDKISAINYVCVDGKSWFSFKVANQTRPIISQEEIDQRDAESNPVFVKIPLDEIKFKPYQNTGDRGILRISLHIPHIELL